MKEIDFDKNIQNKIIVFSHFQKLKINLKEKYNISLTEKNEEIEKIKKLKEESLINNYKINNQKIKELETSFKNYKLKVYIDNIFSLNTGILSIKSNNNCIIYDNKNYTKLYQFKLDKNYNILSVIELDKDLIFLGEPLKNNNHSYYLLIYRLNNNNEYFLFQKIIENIDGFKFEEIKYRLILIKKFYASLWINKYNDKGFICISNYGIKIYELNENNQYSIIFLDPFKEKIENIFIINEKELIMCINFKHEYIFREKNTILIEKLFLKDIQNNQLNQKLKEFNEYNLHTSGFMPIEYNLDAGRKIISSLKLTYIKQNMLIYFTETNEGIHNLSIYIILKNKFFIIMVDNHLLIFNYLTGKQLIRYTFLIYEENNIYINNEFNILKWNNKDDNEFILIKKGNITLFELFEDNKNDINLNIIAYYYSPDINDLKAINSENRFYIKKKGYILLY